MAEDSELRHEREQERTTRTGLFWLSILAAVAFIGIGFCLVNL
jgi:hypothetical protein